MITNFLLDHSALVPVAFILLAVVCVGVGCWITRIRRYRQRILGVLVVLSALPVVVLTLVPAAGRAGAGGCVVQFAVPSLTRVELLANVALFFPPVFFATLATRRPLPVLAAGAGLSAAIEAVQAVVPALGRACDTNDWAMNTLGTILAVALAGATIALTDRKSDRSAGSPVQRD